MIQFISQTDFKIKNKNILKKWIKSVIIFNNKKVGDISFLFLSDEQLLDINKKYLSHDYFTDVITFDYTENNLVSGDIFVSIDRVKENANEFNVTFKDEFLRVMIHGVLHLLEFDDKTDEQKKIVRSLEDKYKSSDLLNNFSL